MPSIIIVAGPNDAGKTSFANEYLPNQLQRYTYVNADEIKRTLLESGEQGSSIDTKAARNMLRNLDAIVARSESVMLETTLATRHCSTKIPEWRRRGYSVGLVYLRLPTVEHSMARVARRVAAGGFPKRSFDGGFTRALST